MVLACSSLTQHTVQVVGCLHGRCQCWSGTALSDSVLIQELAAAGGNILNYTVGPNTVLSTGEMSLNLTVDKDHQWVSAISNRGPTPDQVVGVADLRLCDGDKWRESVKVCFELFSTAAASERVAGEMERNSVQGNNCSFGYIEFNFIEVRDAIASSVNHFCNTV